MKKVFTTLCVSVLFVFCMSLVPLAAINDTVLDSDGLFDGDYITRAHFAAKMVEIFGFQSDIEEEQSPFVDVDDTSEYYEEIMIMYKNGYLMGVNEDEYWPQLFITNAEAAKIVTCILHDEYGVPFDTESTENSGTWYGVYVNTAERLGIIIENKRISGFWEEYIEQSELLEYYIYKAMNKEFDTWHFDDETGILTFRNAENADMIVSLPGCLSQIKKKIVKIVIEDGYETISAQAFSECIKLEQLELPQSLEEICENAFEACTSLEDVYYDGFFSQWQNVIIASGNEPLAEAVIHAEEDLVQSVDGDINGDGVFDYYDVSRLYAFYRGKTTLEDTVDTDINCDGVFNYYDVSRLYAIYRGKTSF